MPIDEHIVHTEHTYYIVYILYPSSSTERRARNLVLDTRARKSMIV